jgi:hypothetical protein
MKNQGYSILPSSQRERGRGLCRSGFIRDKGIGEVIAVETAPTGHG